ncbi:hypothetical protein scyTo_0002120 [Scyliorhinus torazame]|uniref:Growth factor receptor domain-containing protein n=1 Tax=Scyliorhinus torazame TaxID=75743 RepID=A0A401PHQ8_SCYTO|nr:hypothetical protein [Scyliorhinus torazame]
MGDLSGHRGDEYIDNAGECHTCHVFCDRCYGPSDVECITCSTPRFYDSGYCATNCPTGKFDMNGQCYSCHHTCKECTGSEPNNCTSCDQDKFRNDRYLFNSVCREDCPTSHYPAAGNICLPCSSNCEVCTSDTHCVKCSSGYYPNPEGCQQLKCEEGEIADPDYEDCIQCGEGCEKCILGELLHRIT